MADAMQRWGIGGNSTSSEMGEQIRQLAAAGHPEIWSRLMVNTFTTTFTVDDRPMLLRQDCRNARIPPKFSTKLASVAIFAFK